MSGREMFLRRGRLTAIEVESGRSRDAQPGLTALGEGLKPAHWRLVGGDGIAVEDFLLRPVARYN